MKFNKLIPEIKVVNFKKSLYFYNKILGFKVEYQRINFAFLSLQGSQIMIQKINQIWSTGKLEKPFGRGINFQIKVLSIVPIIKSLIKNKYPLFIEPKDNWYKVKNKLLGNREFLVKDPDGYLLRFVENLGIKR